MRQRHRRLPYSTNVSYPDWAIDFNHRCAALSKDHDWKWIEDDCDSTMQSMGFVCEKYIEQQDGYKGSCYELLRLLGGNEKTSEWCQERGGNVVEINTEEEQNFVANFLNRTSVPRSTFTGVELLGSGQPMKMRKRNSSGNMEASQLMLRVHCGLEENQTTQS